MDLTQFIDELRVDLKDSGSVWSAAELTRCINRAVDDVSRHIPRERVYELTYKNAITDESFTTPETSDPDYLVDGVSLDGEVDGATISMTGYYWLDVPRPVIVTLTDANNSTSRMTLIVKGVDVGGAYREEKFFRHDGKVQTGKVYFTSLIQVELNEVSGNGAGDTIDVGTGSHLGVWVQLASPIEPGTETVTTTDGATTYAKDTDYEMDYSNGRICVKDGGSMSAGTAYYINYIKSKRGVDISDIIPELTRIVRVEYPVDKMPQQFVAFEVFGDLLRVGSQKPGESQTYLNDGEHLVIYYDARHSPPTEVSSGSYPEYLDQVVSIGAGAYALLIEALQYEQQAVTDLTSLRTELGLTTAIHTLADAALDKVATYLETNDTTDNAVDVLSNITDDIGDLRTKIQTAQDAINSFLDEVDTTDLAGSGNDSAEGALKAGEDLINTVGLGADVAGHYADYSRAWQGIATARTTAAVGYFQEAASRLDNLRTHIEEAGGWNRIAEDFIAEAAQRIAEIGTHLEEAARYQETVANDLVLSDRFRAEGQQRMAEFQRVLEDRAQYRKRFMSIPLTQPPAGASRTTAARTDRLSS